MDFDSVLAALGDDLGLLTVNDLAQRLQTTARNIDYWRTHHGFPAPTYLPPDRTRYWPCLPVRAWVLLRQRLTHEAIGIEQVCERTGLSAWQWTERVKAGQAPASVARELGTGRKLWWLADVDTWLQQVSGGYRFPRRAAR